MRIVGNKIVDADENGGITKISRSYISYTGLECKEIKTVARESDYVNESLYRISADNGKTYGEWQACDRKSYSEMYGTDEMINGETRRIWNPVHKHYVCTYWTRLFLNGHEDAYKAYWQRGEVAYFDHQYIAVSDSGEGEYTSLELLKYENGDDFSKDNPRNPEFLQKNRGFLNAPAVLKCGDIVVPVGVPVHTACKIAGLDVSEVFPSCPEIHRAVIVARGKFNSKIGKYEFCFSNPVILGDMQSSRGIDEPIVAELECGRLILVMRGSNVQSAAWNTRIKDNTPSYKWFSYSDDGAKSFSSPLPWSFDTKEPVYSAATISEFIRSTKNGKLYWIGNISDERAYGNFPRYPLHICEVDDISGNLKKETLTVIDTRREGESDKLQLSNFALLEDRESLNLELSLSKLGQFDRARPFYGECWRYIINLEPACK